MYNGCWYNCLAYNGDLHAEGVAHQNIGMGITFPVSLSAQSTSPPVIGSPVNIAKGSRL
jgi:hypothetical protein